MLREATDSAHGRQRKRRRILFRSPSAIDGWVPAGRPAAVWSGSAFPGGGLVLLHDAGRDPPALADRDAVFSCPRADLAAALSPGRGPGSPAGRPAARLTGVVEVRLELLAEGSRVLGVQVDLILRALESEPHRLCGWAAVEVVFQR